MTSLSPYENYYTFLRVNWRVLLRGCFDIRNFNTKINVIKINMYRRKNNNNVVTLLQPGTEELISLRMIDHWRSNYLVSSVLLEKNLQFAGECVSYSYYEYLVLSKCGT